MHPMLSEALVASRLDDLRRSVRTARDVALRSRCAAPSVPIPTWTRSLRPDAVAAATLAGRPCVDCGDPA
jgi:hypothetical protein